MLERVRKSSAEAKKIRLFLSKQPHATKPGETVDTFHILLVPPCEATAGKSFLPKSKDRPTNYKLARTESGKIAELIVERKAIGWSSDREAALLRLARGLSREHNYVLDPSIEQLEPGAQTASEAVGNTETAPQV